MTDEPRDDRWFGLTIEPTATGETIEGLYVEHGPIEGGVIYFVGDETSPVRDLFPQRPAERGAIQYPKPLALAPRPQPRRAFLRGEIDRLRAWWRAHWWPARIRALEAELRRVHDDDWN